MIQQQPERRPSDILASMQASMTGSFDWQPTTRVVFGAGTLDRIGALAAELGSRRPLVVTDPGIESAGHPARALECLKKAGLDPVVFDGVEENPTSRHVESGLAVAKDAQIDLFIGLGGGSAMDTAKGINFLLTNGGEMADYWGVGKATRPMLSMIAVPTTAGTGSEAQSFALISNEKTHQKMACGDKKAAPAVAILDPILTLSQPARVAAFGGIDAISHALEAYVTTARNPASVMFATRAWTLLAAGFPRMLDQPQDLEARAMMLLGAHFAGTAIELSMLGATHALANPLTAHFDLTHGLAIGLMLPSVVRYNATVVEPLYAELLALIPQSTDAGLGAGEVTAQLIERWADLADLPQSLAECGVAENSLGRLAQEARQQWTCRFNPRPVETADLEALYRLSYNGRRGL